MLIANSPSDSNERRRPIWLMAGLCLAAAALAGGYIIFRSSAAVAPPVINLAGVDPAVQKAIRDASQQIEQAKKPADAWGKLGMILFNHKFAADALACFEQAERLNAADFRWPYHQGLILMADDPPRALPKISRAAHLAGGAVDRPRLRLAELFLQVGQFDAGQQELALLLEKNPSHPRVNLAMARVQFQAGKLDETRARLSPALAHPLTRVAALRLSAELYQRQGDAESARQELAQAQTAQLPDDPDWPDEILEQTQLLAVGEAAGINQANKLLDRMRVREAAVLLQEIVHDYPESARGWLLLGYAQMNLRKYPEAETSLHTALRLNPKSASALLNLGTLKDLQKDRPAAIAWFRKAIEQNPDSLQACLGLGRCLKESGDKKGAIDALQRALRCQPSSATAHAQLGELLLQDNQVDAALPHLRQAVELNPNDAASRSLLDTARQRQPKANP